MRKLFSRRLPSCLLALVMAVSLTPFAAARAALKAEVDAGEQIEFSRTDFRDFFDAAAPEDSLYYLEFTSFDQLDDYGCLYAYDHQDKLQKLDEKLLKNAWFYYSAGDVPKDCDYALSGLTFAAHSTASDGTLELEFALEGDDDRTVSGTLEIRVNASSSDDEHVSLRYNVDADDSITLDPEDFRNAFEKLYDDFSYLVFTDADGLDTAGSFQGYDRYWMESVSFNESTLTDTRFYAESTDQEDLLIEDLTFFADEDAAGDLTLDFTLYGGRNNRAYGTLTLKIKGKTTPVSTGTIADIRYYTTYNTSLQLKSGDFAAFFRRHFPNDSLQSVRLNNIPKNGSLYYNYYSASRYGAARTAMTADNYSRQPFYANPADTSQFALTELTYVPYSTNYCDVISFTAHGTGGNSAQGTIVIGVTLSSVPEVYGITPKNTTVAIPPSAIYSAVSSATGANLAGIQLLELPPASIGTVTAVSGTVSSSVSTSTLYRYGSGTNQMSHLRFTPADGYTGSVEIPYAAINSDGTPIASGKFCLGVVSSMKRFSDVPSSFWCYKYVTELSDAGVINGYADGTFRPNSTITYGAALKLIMLAAGYGEQAPVDSHVFSGYLARAQADGIITRSNVNLSGPINRLQVAQLAAGAMKLDVSNLSSVKPFTDTSDAHVQALNAAGIVEGYFSNGTSTYKPGNTLTRGQVSAIVWRMMNYSK